MGLGLPPSKSQLYVTPEACMEGSAFTTNGSPSQLRISSLSNSIIASGFEFIIIGTDTGSGEAHWLALTSTETFLIPSVVQNKV